MAPLYSGLETVVIEAHWDDGDATFWFHHRATAAPFAVASITNERGGTVAPRIDMRYRRGPRTKETCSLRSPLDHQICSPIDPGAASERNTSCEL
jgi:hypothetical protein